MFKGYFVKFAAKLQKSFVQTKKKLYFCSKITKKT